MTSPRDRYDLCPINIRRSTKIIISGVPRLWLGEIMTKIEDLKLYRIEFFFFFIIADIVTQRDNKKH